MITGLDHIAIAVPDIQRAITRFAMDFGLTHEHTERVENQQTVTAFFPLAATSIELVHPIDNQGPIAKFLAKKPGGIHHLCFRTDNIDADVAHLKDKGYEFLSDTPQPGAHGCQVIFIHPKSCDGVLIELSQPPN